MSLPSTGFHDEWVAALDRLECDVELAESMLCSNDMGDLQPWSAPEVGAPLPHELQDRARLVLERQLAVAHALSRRLTNTGRERTLAERIRDTSAPEVPVYVDLNA